MPPRRLPKRSKIAPRGLPGGSRAPPESANESGHLFCSFFSSLGRLLGLSWGAPGGSWGSWALPGRSWGAFSPPGGLLLESFGPLFSNILEKHAKTLNFDDSCSENQGFYLPGGSKIEPKWLQNRSWHLLVLIWRLSALSWRLLAASWRLLGPLGRLLGRSWGDF